MSNRSLLLLTILLVLSLCSLAQVPLLSRGQLFSKDSSTTFSGYFDCEALVCLGYSSTKLTFPTSFYIMPSTVSLQFTVNPKTTSLSSVAYNLDPVTPNNNVAEFTFGSEVFGTLNSASKYRIHFVFTLNWDAAPGKLPHYTQSVSPLIANEWYIMVSGTQRAANVFSVSTFVGETLEFDHEAEVPTIDPHEYSARVVPTTFAQQAEGTEAYKGIFSFTNYYNQPIVGFELSLTGSNYFYVNATNIAAHSCSLNGNEIPVDIHLEESTNEKDDRYTQLISISIPSSFYPLTGHNALLTLTCGGGLNYLQIVHDARIFKSFATDKMPKEFLTLKPLFQEDSSSSEDSFPQSLLVFPISPSDLLSANSLPLVDASPVSAYADRKMKVDGVSVPASIAASFELHPTSYLDMTRPIELTIEFTGLSLDTTKAEKNPKEVPRAIVVLEPDYSIETYPNGLKTPKTPPGLTSNFYITPLDLTTQSSPTLKLDKGLMSTYAEGTAPSMFDTIPKRFITVVIPQMPLKVSSYPVQITLNIKYTSTDATIQNPMTLVSAALISNKDSDADPKSWQWKSTSIQASNLQFDVHPVNKSLITSYPSLITQSFPTFRYRYAFPAATTGTTCQVTRQVCTRSSSYNEHEEDDEETIPLSNIIAPATDVQYKVRRSSTRSCRMVSDNSFYFRTSIASQMRVDLSVQTIVPGYIPNGWRRVECSGSTLIEQKPLVFDFTDAKAMQAADTSSTISLSPSSIAKPSTSWGAVTKNGVSAVISHKFQYGGNTVGFNEVYNLKNRLSTGAIVAICLIPLYLGVIIAVVVVAIVLCK